MHNLQQIIIDVYYSYNLCTINRKKVVYIVRQMPFILNYNTMVYLSYILFTYISAPTSYYYIIIII